MTEWASTAAAVLQRAQSLWLRKEVGGTFLCLVVLFLLVPLFRRAGGRGLRAAFVRSALTDLTYTVFYVGGFYAFLVSGPVRRLLDALVLRYAGFLRLDLLAALPAFAQFLLGYVIGDGINYWVHRWLHASPVLWAFHSIHHSQRELSPLTHFRLHAGDILTRTVLLFLPGLVLGVPDVAGIPLIWTTAWITVVLEGLAHSGLSWSFGPLEAVLVSPRFHRLHHSSDPRHFNRNFGATFTFWDRLFGTAVPPQETPASYGEIGLDVPESFWGQLPFPFLHLARSLGAPARPAAAPRPARGEAIP